ncbi:alpha-L-iduronidase isoform X2 [Anabrus simplex]
MSLVVAVCLLVCCSWTLGAVPRVVVDVTSGSPGELKHFWTSTGLCPPAPHTEAYKSLLSADYMMNLVLMSALPHRGISHVRIHWLLELVSLRLEDDGVRYNWTHLDTLLDWMHGHNLFPGFELMGNPSGFFTDFDNDTQVHQWHHLVATLVDRYNGRYGAENVSLWRFETWNEPDLKGYNTIPFSLTGYLRYWNASAVALKNKRQNELRIGGPAGLFKKQRKHPLCWGFLDYCAQTSCPVDFLSFHKKGNRSGAAILRQGVQLARKIYNHYPQLRGIPIANDEADPLTGWSHSELWRADVRYGAMVAHVIARHHQVMVRKLGLSLEVISNDNGFLNYHPYYFSQRTLLARFQMNNTVPPHIQFFRKPVYMTMGLLSFLEQTELRVSIKHWRDRRLAVLAAMDEVPHEGWTASVVLAFSADTEEYPGVFFNLSLVVKHILSGNVSEGDILYTVWLLDNDHTNPSRVWQQAGAPVFPNRTLRQIMRAAEGPYRLVPLTAVPSSGRLRVPLSLPLPAVVLLHVCRRAATPPGPVTLLEVFNVTFGEVLLKWDDSFVGTRCIKTYEVQFSPSHAAGPDQFRRINVEDIIFLSFQYVAVREAGEAVRGVYRVRAVDYWGRPGKFSPQVRYPEKD